MCGRPLITIVERSTIFCVFVQHWTQFLLSVATHRRSLSSIMHGRNIMDFSVLLFVFLFFFTRAEDTLDPPRVVTFTQCRHGNSSVYHWTVFMVRLTSSHPYIATCRKWPSLSCKELLLTHTRCMLHFFFIAVNLSPMSSQSYTQSPSTRPKVRSFVIKFMRPNGEVNGPNTNQRGISCIISCN